MKTKEEQTVFNYFNAQGANLVLNLPQGSDPQAIYEYLAELIDANTLELDYFQFQGYSCSYFDQDHIIHNFYFEQVDFLYPTAQALIDSLANEPILEQDDSQPAPYYTLSLGSLYITIIGEA